jgi:MFS family permease
LGDGIIVRGTQFLRKQERSFNVNMLRRSIENFANTLVTQYQSIYLIALGADSVQIGLVNSLASVGSTLIAIPSGWAIDRYGLKKTFTFGTFFMAVGTLMFALSTDWSYTIPALFLFTLAASVNRTSCPVVCGSSLINEDRAVGMQLCDSLAAISGIIAPIAGAALIASSGGMTAEGIRPVYYLQLAVLVLELIIITWMFTNPSKRTISKMGFGMLDGVREVFKQGVSVKRFLFYQSIFMIPLYLNTIYIPLYAAQVKGADAFTLGGMATAALLVPLILSIPSGRLADRIGRKKVVFLCMPLYCLSLLLLAVAPVGNSFMLIAAGVFQGFYTLGMVTGNAIRAEIVPISLLGSWGGVLGLFGGIIGVVVPLVAGYMWRMLSPLSVILILIVSVVVAAIGLSAMPETLKMERKI